MESGNYDYYDKTHIYNYYKAVERRDIEGIVTNFNNDHRNISVYDKIGWIPVRTAVRRGDLEILKLFMSLGYDPNDTDDEWSQTAVNFAAQCNNVNMVKYLINIGCDTKTIPKLHFTKHECAIEIIKMLVDMNYDYDSITVKSGIYNTNEFVEDKPVFDIFVSALQIHDYSSFEMFVCKFTNKFDTIDAIPVFTSLIHANSSRRIRKIIELSAILGLQHTYSNFESALLNCSTYPNDSTITTFMSLSVWNAEIAERYIEKTGKQVPIISFSEIIDIKTKVYFTRSLLSGLLLFIF